jgi:hypothetical protein
MAVGDESREGGNAPRVLSISRDNREGWRCWLQLGEKKQGQLEVSAGSKAGRT